MEWTTHALSGVVAGYLVTGGDWKGAVVGGVAGVIPDLDEPKSKFGRILFPISIPLSAFFEHRTFTHSLLFAGLLGGISYFFFEKWVALAIIAGILAHILGDMLTGKVKLFYPIDKSIGIPIPQILFTPVDRVARVLLFIYSLFIVWNDYISQIQINHLAKDTVGKIPFF